MKKIVLQAFILIFIFIGIYKVLEQVNWISILKIEDKIRYSENKLGNLFLNEILQQYEVDYDSTNNQIIDTLFCQICASNKLNKSDYKFYLIQNPEVNAFALPGNNIILNTGLIKQTKTDAEMAGVMAHEIAHINLNHIREKLAREAGLSLIITMSTGNTDIAFIHNTIKLLATTAFDRKSEFEADNLAVRYLENSHLNPDDFAKLLLRISKSNDETGITWLSTHPETIERANKIYLMSDKNKFKYVKIFSDEEWQKIAQTDTLQVTNTLINR